MIKLPVGVDINSLIINIKSFCWEASDIFAFYSRMIKDSNNNDEIIKTNNNDPDPVTLADLKVNELIISKIKNKYCNISWEILSEENVKFESNTFKYDNDWLWVFDPLDGTKDFIQNTGNYAMHLALNYKQKPQIGFVLIPEKNELWIAVGGKIWGERRDGSVVEAKISKKNNLNRMNLVTSKNHKNQNLKKLIDYSNFLNVIEMGSIGCKIASIIKGESDIYISLSLPHGSAPKDWDFAAPETILKAAGGAITYINNKELIYNQKDFEQRGIIVATNNILTHGKICDLLKNIIKKYDLYPL